MDAKDFIKISAKEIRNSNELMRLYIQLYEGAFSIKPDCAPCTFNKDFKRFKRHVEQLGINQTIIINPKNTRKMGDFKLKNKYKGDIMTYKDGKKPVRTYGRKMTKEFAVNFLTKGTEKQIAERKELFSVLPDVGADPFEEKAAADAKVIELKKTKEADAKDNVDVNADAGDKAAADVTEKKAKERELKSLKRVELDVAAKEVGLNPSDYVNKALLIEAIEKAR